MNLLHILLPGGLGKIAFSLLFLIVLAAGSASAATFESFLEPAHQADLIPANRDVIQKIHVKEGDAVKKGQLLISLNADILKARLQAADIMAEAHGKLDSARIMEKMRQDQLEDLTRLAKSGNVRAKELERAEADLAIAKADVLAMQEERRIRAAEQQQIKAQVAEKEIRSPIDGSITHLSKEEGELTGTSEQDILVTVVQEHPLRAVFHLPAANVHDLKTGLEVRLSVDQGNQTLAGEVEFISPVTNPESGTVKVKVQLRGDEKMQAGLRCHLILADPVEQPVLQQSKQTLAN
jgi:RND family efflux transporter MFP subunit